MVGRASCLLWDLPLTLHPRAVAEGNINIILGAEDGKPGHVELSNAVCKQVSACACCVQSWQTMGYHPGIGLIRGQQFLTLHTGSMMLRNINNFSSSLQMEDVANQSWYHVEQVSLQAIGTTCLLWGVLAGDVIRFNNGGEHGLLLHCKQVHGIVSLVVSNYGECSWVAPSSAAHLKAKS